MTRTMSNERTVAELQSLATSGDYAMMLRRSGQIADHAARSEDPRRLASQLASVATEGPIAALMAIESLVGVQHPLADDALVRLLSHPDHVVRRHAVWRLGERAPTLRAYPALIDALMLGGIDTMHAHRTLRVWSSADSLPIGRLLIGRLATMASAAERARIVDLLGVLRTDTDDVLLHVALDAEEAAAVRRAAIGALGERPGDPIKAALRRLATSDEAVSTDAGLALTGNGISGLPTPVNHRDAGIRVAQLVLAEGLDGQLSLGGKGDTGGVASLLVSLGEALASRLDVDHVLTIGRGSLSDAFTGPFSSSRTPLSYGTVAFGDDARPAVTPGEIWEHLPVIERSLRRVLHRAGPIDVLHLRMADAGTLAGAEVAAELGIPICFSVAPDPHNIIDSLQSRGELDDESFLSLLAESHVWFRARMVERLTADAEQLAVFPRSRPIAFLDEIVSQRSSDRVAVVAEGIDLRLLDQAAETTALSQGTSRRRDVLEDLSASIPEFRRNLPLVLSVGRLNPVKGMDRVVTAWASDARLHETCNLVIVGGDLDDPSPTERAVLAQIDRAVPADDPRRAGLVLLGGRPHLDVARLQLAAVSGRDGVWSEGGIYVDGAVKEEFGLAVLEALAAGLPVVAPSTGGPSTYVDHGDIGVLVDPSDCLVTAMLDAFGLVSRPGRAQRARTIVEDRYSIDSMAAQLADLYEPAMAVR